VEQIGLKTDTGDVKKLCFCAKSMFYFCTKQRRKVYPICQFNDTRKLVSQQKNRDENPHPQNEISLKRLGTTIAINVLYLSFQQ